MHLRGNRQRVHQLLPSHSHGRTANRIDSTHLFLVSVELLPHRQSQTRMEKPPGPLAKPAKYRVRVRLDQLAPNRLKKLFSASLGLLEGEEGSVQFL
jgi:hypothetical protein